MQSCQEWKSCVLFLYAGREATTKLQSKQQLRCRSLAPSQRVNSIRLPVRLNAPVEWLKLSMPVSVGDGSTPEGLQVGKPLIDQIDAKQSIVFATLPSFKSCERVSLPWDSFCSSFFWERLSSSMNCNAMTALIVSLTPWLLEGPRADSEQLIFPDQAALYVVCLPPIMLCMTYHVW